MAGLVLGSSMPPRLKHKVAEHLRCLGRVDSLRRRTYKPEKGVACSLGAKSLALCLNVCYLMLCPPLWHQRPC